MKWLKQALTGADNQTVAIGRLVGFMIAVVLLTGLPILAAATIIRKDVPVDDWGTFFQTLALYVVPVSASIGGLIWGTNGTEPKPKPHDDGGNANG
jgi:hypothetical protein